MMDYVFQRHSGWVGRAVVGERLVQIGVMKENVENVYQPEIFNRGLKRTTSISKITFLHIVSLPLKGR